MSTRKNTVHRYFDGFRASDHEVILSLLTEDVVWHLPGYKTLQGKAAFDGEIENPAFDGSPTLSVDRLIEESDTVAAVGMGAGRLAADGGTFRFAFCTVLTFAGDLIARVESYVVPLAGPPPD